MDGAVTLVFQNRANPSNYIQRSNKSSSFENRSIEKTLAKSVHHAIRENISIILHNL